RPGAVSGGAWNGPVLADVDGAPPCRGRREAGGSPAPPRTRNSGARRDVGPGGVGRPRGRPDPGAGTGPGGARGPSSGAAPRAGDDVFRGEDPVERRGGARAAARDREEPDPARHAASPVDAPGPGADVMSRRTHDELEELIAADALDGLSEADRRHMLEEMAAHGPGCAACARLLADYAQVAAKLSTLVEPMPVSAGAERRLVRALGATGAPAPSE